MVKRVFGRVDGCEVELNRSEGDWWNVPVPFDTDGEYVVEILAEDEAGNQAYIAKMLFVVNTALLCAHVEPVPYYGQLLETEWEAELVAPQIYTQEIRLPSRSGMPPGNLKATMKPKPRVNVRSMGM